MKWRGEARRRPHRCAPRPLVKFFRCRSLGGQPAWPGSRVTTAGTRSPSGSFAIPSFGNQDGDRGDLVVAEISLGRCENLFEVGGACRSC